MNRRKILLASSFTLTTVLSGCMGNSTGSEESQSEPDATPTSDDDPDCSVNVVSADHNYGDRNVEIDVLLQNTGNVDAVATIIVEFTNASSSPFEYEEEAEVPAGEVLEKTIYYGRGDAFSADSVVYKNTKVGSEECVDNLSSVSTSGDTEEESRTREERQTDLVEKALEDAERVNRTSNDDDDKYDQ